MGHTSLLPCCLYSETQTIAAAITIYRGRYAPDRLGVVPLSCRIWLVKKPQEKIKATRKGRREASEFIQYRSPQ